MVELAVGMGAGMLAPAPVEADVDYNVAVVVAVAAAVDRVVGSWSAFIAMFSIDYAIYLLHGG